MNLRDNSLGENYVLFRNWAILTIFGLNFLQKTANRDFVKILRFAVSVFLNFYCGSVLVRFGLDTLKTMPVDAQILPSMPASIFYSRHAGQSLRVKFLSNQKIKWGTYFRDEKLSFWEPSVKICDVAGTPILPTLWAFQSINKITFVTSRPTKILFVTFAEKESEKFRISYSSSWHFLGQIFLAVVKWRRTI